MPNMNTWKERGTLFAEGNTTAETTVDTTPRKIAALATKGVEAGLTVDTTNNKITVGKTGDYLVIGSVSFSGTISGTYNVSIFKNLVSTNLTLERKLGTGGDVGSATVQGIVSCSAGDDLSLYQSTADGSIMTVTDGQLSVVRLS